MKLTKAFDEIVAYTYQADIYCPECVLEVMDYEPRNRNTNSVEDYLSICYGVVEDYLNEIASDPSYPINRSDEYSFDSDIFPKVVFACMLENDYGDDTPTRCGGCEAIF